MDRSVEFDDKQIDFGGLIDILADKVSTNQNFTNRKGKHKPKSTNVIITSKKTLHFEEAIELVDVIQGTGARVVALSIPTFCKQKKLLL